MLEHPAPSSATTSAATPSAVTAARRRVQAPVRHGHRAMIDWPLIQYASQRRHTVGDLPRLIASPPGIATSPWPAEELPVTNVQTMVDVLRFVSDGAV
jgi:hypothetical protein